MATREHIIHEISKLQFLPNSPITQSTIKGVMDSFEAVLSDLPAETVTAAVRQYLGTETFFPTPGRIREIGMDLQMLAMGFPTPAEAWGMVLTAERHVDSFRCEEMYRYQLRAEEAVKIHDGKAYNEVMYLIINHNCGVCTTGGIKEVYAHPAVEETVKMLGGRNVILTDNPVADRARFIPAYQEVIARERMRTAMLPEVRKYVEEKQRLLTVSPMKQLSERLSK